MTQGFRGDPVGHSSHRIIKAVWGADSDITSLMHAPAANPLSISSSSLVDVQLGFCTPSKRLSMSKMLQRVPPKRIERLPSKALAPHFASTHRHEHPSTTPFYFTNTPPPPPTPSSLSPHAITHTLTTSSNYRPRNNTEHHTSAWRYFDRHA